MHAIKKADEDMVAGNLESAPQKIIVEEDVKSKPVLTYVAKKNEKLLDSVQKYEYCDSAGLPTNNPLHEESPEI